jgi:uncharacterized membrane protein YkvA (DUF1232 family)
MPAPDPSPTPEKPRALRRRGLSAVPFLGDVLPAGRLIRDKAAPVWAKLLLFASVAYVVWPLDLVPDAIPILTWLDDMGFVVAVRLILSRQLDRYRLPSNASPPGAPSEPPAPAPPAAHRK